MDDEGTVFTTDGTPTIISVVGDALSLEHMGLSHAQIIGTIGERCQSGSNLNGGYDNGNLYTADGTLDHNAVDHDPSHWPSDPVSAEEAAMIAQSADLTPSCSSQCFWCTGAEGEVVAQLDAHGWPDFIIQGAFAGAWPMTWDVVGNATARSVPIIKLNDGGQGYIEITQRYEELANFLGATPDLSADKAALCTEVNKFKATAAAAAERGVRALGTYAPYGPVADGVAGGYLIGANGYDQVQTMLEELGMQILHVDSNLGDVVGGGYWGWEWGSFDATALPYPVDFWLYDSRVTLDFVSETFAADWPHPAVVAKQYAYWPSAGYVHSYEHATDILRLVGEALGEANRIEDATECTEVADVTDADYRLNGLAPGEYACPKPVDYDWCAAPTRHFVDDAGYRHSTHKTAPTVVVNIQDALGLQDMGLTRNQVHGTIGQRAISGSNFGGWQGNNVMGHNSGDSDWNPWQFPADPHTAEEMDMVARAIDLTPSCAGINNWCRGGEPGEVVASLDAHGWPDFIIESAFGSNSGLRDDVRGNASAHGVPIIKLSDSAADSGAPLGFIEISQRYEELATFLGATADLSDQKAALCHEVNKFKATAAAAAARGVRSMAIYAPLGPIVDGIASTYVSTAGKDQTLNMLEELGMQVVHHSDANGWGYWEKMIATPDGVLDEWGYAVDFWLYDQRVTFDFTSEAFAEQWPHPAVVAKQYAYWALTGQVHSYEHGTEILQLVGEALGRANKVAGDKSCTAVADVTAADYRLNGLGPGEYACPKPVDYDWCAVHATPSPVPAPTLKPTPAPDDDDKDDGPTENDVASAGGGAAAAGVVVGLAAGGVLGVLYAKKTNAAPMEQKAYDVSTDRV